MIITIKNNFITATIDTFGAELKSLIKDNYNYIWTVNHNYWNKTSPILFPIVGQLKNNEYAVFDKKYNLLRHGFARDLEFDIVTNGEQFVTLSLKENKTTLTQYPFHFELHVNFTLVDHELIIKYLVINNSTTNMPFSIGAHPAFTIRDCFNKYSLLFDDDTVLENHQLSDGFFSGEKESMILNKNKLSLSYNIFANDALVFKKFKSKSITILEDDKPYVKIGLQNFPNLGIWTKADAPFLCIEPWFGYADDLNATGNILEKSGIQILAINNTFETSFSIEIL
jgi:galactose mutarotase-like enzyme